ncbi:hypothetical protein I7I53_01719 [Histoplasma capsulatum var. duboisii H88]|uniref:Uncharacterized protein n=1 Tax=Ajellomyces capsulatus (strain H88) TaxID=544711 RepID=A0A8A1LIM6_AJEC8|nr:hypothetical protein I7I53_01719 [Histoplasma capsulatum var. duboisii H88]
MSRGPKRYLYFQVGFTWGGRAVDDFLEYTRYQKSQCNYNTAVLDLSGCGEGNSGGTASRSRRSCIGTSCKVV